MIVGSVVVVVQSMTMRFSLPLCELTGKGAMMPLPTSDVLALVRVEVSPPPNGVSARDVEPFDA